MEEELLAAAEDFAEALLGEGPREALNSLRSFATELRDAPEEVVHRLVAAFEQALVATTNHPAPYRTEEEWAQHAELAAELHALAAAAGSAAAAARLLSAWRAGLGAVLRGQGSYVSIPGDDHLVHVAAVRRWAADAVAGAAALHRADDFVGRAGVAAALVRAAACLYVLHADSLPPESAAELFSLLTESSGGSGGAGEDAALGRIQAAFEAAAEVAQSGAALAQLARAGAPAQCALAARAWQFLQLFRRGPPASVDAWWGVYGSAVYQFLDAAKQQGGVGAALERHAALRAVAGVLCQADSAPMLTRFLLAHEDYGGGSGRDGPRRALQAAEALLQGDLAATVAGCAEVLTPAANAALPARQEALHAMGAAAERFLSQHADDPEAQGWLWLPHALDALLFAMGRDPSLRVRREAAKLLPSIRAPQGSPQAAQVLAAACLRCRDRDAAVRQEAYAALLTLPDASLHAALTVTDWRCLLDVGLAPEALKGGGGVKGGGVQADKHAAAVRAAATTLLQRFLKVDDEAGGPGEWSRRLQAVVGPGLSDGTAAGAALSAGYAAALRRVLPAARLLEAAAADG